MSNPNNSPTDENNIKNCMEKRKVLSQASAALKGRAYDK